MKKLFALIMAIVLVFSMAACGNNAADNKTEQTDSTSETVMNTNPADDEQENTDATDASTKPSEDAESNTDSTEDTTEATEEEATEPSSKPADTTPTEGNTNDKPSEPTEGHTHSYTSSVKAATCVEEGYTYHKCACGDSYTSNKTNATGHSWGPWNTTKEATTFAKGEAERKCSACGKTEKKDIDKKPVFHTHEYKDTVVAATCTNEGYTIHTCDCGASYTDNTTAKLDHSYSAKDTAPTCTTEGYTTYTCSCGNSYIGNKKAKTDHNYKTSTTAPTCDKEGYDTHTCSTCGGNYVDNKTVALGHNYTHEVVNPTCTVDGYTKHICTRCAYSYKDTTTAATKHAYSFTSNTATCTANGIITETCSKCGDTKTSSSSATGHQKTHDVTSPATCVSKGYTNTVCDACNATVKTVEIAQGSCEIVRMGMRAAIEECEAAGIYSYTKYYKLADLTVEKCKYCHRMDMNSAQCKYDAYTAASIMLGYVNQLREEVFGTSEYNLTLNSNLINIATQRAKEISVDFSHAGANQSSIENITNDSTIYAQFMSFKNSSSHYNNMIDPMFTTFGYGYFFDLTEGTSMFGVQVFS